MIDWLLAFAGRIIHIGSTVGINGNIGQSVYSASKAGLHGKQNLYCQPDGVVFVGFAFLFPYCTYMLSSHVASHPAASVLSSKVTVTQ